MNTRLFAAALVIVALASGAVVIGQHRQLAELRDQNQRTADATKRANEQRAAETAAQDVPVIRPSAELLELRSKVTQLMARKNELASARTENDQLQSQVTAHGTNSSVLPADYIRARDAQWVGASTIESTIQSFLWTLRHADTNALFQLLSPKSANQLAETLQHKPADEVFKEASLFPGMRITERKQLPDGSIEAKIEMLPGQPEIGSFHFQLINGQWKMDLP